MLPIILFLPPLGFLTVRNYLGQESRYPDRDPEVILPVQRRMKVSGNRIYGEDR